MGGVAVPVCPGMDSASGKNRRTNHNLTRNPSRGQTRAGGGPRPTRQDFHLPRNTYPYPHVSVGVAANPRTPTVRLYQEVDILSEWGPILIVVGNPKFRGGSSREGRVQRMARPRSLRNGSVMLEGDARLWELLGYVPSWQGYALRMGRSWPNDPRRPDEREDSLGRSWRPRSVSAVLI